jgi:hypothetical protein
VGEEGEEDLGVDLVTENGSGAIVDPQTLILPVSALDVELDGHEEAAADEAGPKKQPCPPSTAHRLPATQHSFEGYLELQRNNPVGSGNKETHRQSLKWTPRFHRILNT